MLVYKVFDEVRFNFLQLLAIAFNHFLYSILLFSLDHILSDQRANSFTLQFFCLISFLFFLINWVSHSSRIACCFHIHVVCVHVST